jgi:hypothetical protein
MPEHDAFTASPRGEHGSRFLAPNHGPDILLLQQEDQLFQIWNRQDGVNYYSRDRWSRMERTLFIENRVLADWHCDQTDLFALTIRRALVDCDAKAVRGEDVEVFHHSDFVGSGEVELFWSGAIGL